jgi:hypothetical protein
MLEFGGTLTAVSCLLHWFAQQIQAGIRSAATAAAMLMKMLKKPQTATPLGAI